MLSLSDESKSPSGWFLTFRCPRAKNLGSTSVRASYSGANGLGASSSAPLATVVPGRIYYSAELWEARRVPLLTSALRSWAETASVPIVLSKI